MGLIVGSDPDFPDPEFPGLPPVSAQPLNVDSRDMVILFGVFYSF